MKFADVKPGALFIAPWGSRWHKNPDGTQSAALFSKYMSCPAGYISTVELAPDTEVTPLELWPVPAPKPARKRKPGAKYKVVPLGDVARGELCAPFPEPPLPETLRDLNTGKRGFTYWSLVRGGDSEYVRCNPAGYAIVKARRPRAYYRAKRAAQNPVTP